MQTASSISSHGFGGKPTTSRSRATAASTVPDQMRSSTPSTTVTASPSATSTNTVVPIAPSRLPFDTRCSAIIAAVRPDAVPAARSISPVSSTNTRPIAMMVCPAPCWSRLARLSRLGNVSLASAVNRMNSASRPRRAGSAPRSPPRSLVSVGADRLAGRLRRGVDPEVGRPAGGGACLLGGARRRVRVRVLLLHRCHQTVTLSGRCRPSSPERPEVINSTAWVWVTSLVRTWATIRPR